jgi:hypothetical protein
MKTLNFEKSFDIFAEYVLSNEEMITIKGGDGDPVPLPPTLPPPIVI